MRTVASLRPSHRWAKGVDMTRRWTGPGPFGPWDKPPAYPLLPTASWTTLRVAHMPTPSTTVLPASRGPPPGKPGRKTIVSDEPFRTLALYLSPASIPVQPVRNRPYSPSEFDWFGCPVSSGFGVRIHWNTQATPSGLLKETYHYA